MNKKFSTLVASLLLSSAFSVYAGNAKPMLATPTQVETRATSADVEEVVELAAGQVLPVRSFDFLNLGTFEGSAALSPKVLAGFVNDSRLAYVGRINAPYTSSAATSFLFGAQGATSTTTVGSYNTAFEPNFYWSFVNGELINDNGEKLSVNQLVDNYEIVPVKENGAADASQFFAIARRNSNGEIQYVKLGSSNILEFTTASGSYLDKIDEAALFVSVETAFLHPVAGDDLNLELGNGFELFISSKVKDDAEIVNADVFAGKLSVVEVAGVTNDATKYYQIKNAAGKFIVFDSNEKITSDGYSKMGQFKLVDAVSAGQYSNFRISKADNGSEDIVVNVLSDESPAKVYRLYIANAAGTYALTISDQNPVAENWAATSLSGDNYTDLRQFLAGKYVTIDFVKAGDPTDSNNDYKKNGRLAVLYNTISSSTANHADYVPVSSLYDKAPEAQWAVSSAYKNGEPYYDGTITLTNRENPAVHFDIDVKGLRNVRNTVDTYEVVSDLAGTNIWEGEQIKISFVEEHNQNDGYAVFDANDLRNKTWYLGQTRQTADGDINVYWTENHAGSHQIGATVEEEKASKWNLSVVKKELAKHENETDSVLVVSTLNKWNSAKSRIDAVQDTLVILPYAFQNRSNAEFVKFNAATNLNYYECREYNLGDDKVYDKANDARFALKMKANGSYNFVAVDANTYEGDASVAINNDGIAAKKVFQENSALLGTWSQMNMYAKDANSLMFVTEVTAPEYRKLVTTANLDTIKIYRADNEAQVVYEKKDTKASTLLERPVSFLNIDNVEQFKDINPALYADTAYVNRGNNTRYQYLLGVNIEHKEGWYCDEHGFTETPPCKHAVPVSYNQGRYLINMIDTANILAADLKVSIHNNPFINETEEGNKCAKLAFVDAIHVLTDSVDMTKADKLYVINNEEDRTKYSVIDLSTPGFNVAKFAFKYTDSMVDDNFKIQTLWKEYDPAKAQGKHSVTEEGYLRWVNGCVVVDNEYAKGDVFNMNEDETRTPTANEEITAEGSVVVAGTNGAVVVKGAEGKSVIVSTILGKVVANEVVSSDNATIAAPAGVVVVSVDGESFKVVVK